MRVIARTYATDGPGDSKGLETLLTELPVECIKRLAIIGKTEGTATINDFSRELATKTAEQTLRTAGGDALLDRSTLIFSTGCEGVLSPCLSVIACIDDATDANASPETNATDRRLAMGGARSRPLNAEELQTPIHAQVVGEAVKAAMNEAGLVPSEVSIVFVKSPILTHKAAVATGDQDVIARSGSSGSSRGAAALGVALALGEIDDATVQSTRICTDLNVYATRAMTFSGTEVTSGEIVVLGNRVGIGGSCQIYSEPVQDILDARSLKRLFRRAGCNLDDEGELTGTGALHAVFLKAGVAQDGLVRGARTTVFQSEVDPDKHMRAAASGLIGGLLGTTQVFVSGGAEHQAPPGGGLAACIAEV